MERRISNSEFRITSHGPSPSTPYTGRERSKPRHDDGPTEEDNRQYREPRQGSNHVQRHHQQQHQQHHQQHQLQDKQHTHSNRRHNTPNNVGGDRGSHEITRNSKSSSSQNYDVTSSSQYGDESNQRTEPRRSSRHDSTSRGVDHISSQRSSKSRGHDDYCDDGDVSSVRSSVKGSSSIRGEYSDKSSDTTSIRGESRERNRGDDDPRVYYNYNSNRHHNDIGNRRSGSSRRRVDPDEKNIDSAGYQEYSEYSRNCHEQTEEYGVNTQPRDSYSSRRVMNKEIRTERYDIVSSQRYDDNEIRAHEYNESKRRGGSSTRGGGEPRGGGCGGDNDKHRMSSRRRRDIDYNTEELQRHKSFDESDSKILEAEIYPEPAVRDRDKEQRVERSGRSRRSASSQNLDHQNGSEPRRRSSSRRHSSQDHNGTSSRKNGHSERCDQSLNSKRKSRTSLVDENAINDEVISPSSHHRERSYGTDRYQSTPKEHRRRDGGTRTGMHSSESRHSNIIDDVRRRDVGKGEVYYSESRNSIPRDQFYETATVDRRSYRHRGSESDSRHDIASLHRRRSVSSYDEPEINHGHHFRRDNSLSNRSSSSRSNHDTGFHSSASSPRREESVSRFSSDISPSRYYNDDPSRQGYDATTSRRKARISSSSNNNNSLDVPQPSLRKDRSLSSSGRGDSSFEETGMENDVKKTDSQDDIIDTQITNPNTGKTNMFNGDIVNNEIKHREKDNTKPSAPNTQSQNEIGKDMTVSPEKILSQEESTRAECTSSTSTLRGGNMTSKTSFAGSISSLLSRDQPSRSGTSEYSFSMSSVSDKWRKLRQGIAPDQGSTSSFASGTASLFSAASRLMSSLPKVPSSFPKAFSSTTVHSEPPKPPMEKIVADSKTAPCSPQSIITKETKTEPTIINNNNKSPPYTSNSAPPSSTKSPSQGINKSPSCNNNSSHIGSANDALSPRTSLASTSLSLQSKRPNTFEVNKEHEQLEEEEDLPTPESEQSGQMTPPPMDADMKRRSKEVYGELTSFLPAEMSRREEKFHDAARMNDAGAIKTILREKVNVNCRNSLDRTALHWASANGNLAAAEALVDGGADLEAKDKYGMRAVLWAAWFGHIPVLQALVNAGANTKITNKQGLGILHCAAENNHSDVVAFIFESLEPHDVNLSDKNDQTALHAAAEHGHVQAVDVLLQAQADLHKKDKSGRTCVHLAGQKGHVDVLKVLLLQGVEVDDRDVDGKTALHLAAEGGHKDIVDLLLDYTANPNSETIKEITPLHVGAMEGHVEVCKSLVKYGCNVNAQNFGNTALHLAANANHKDVARVLVDVKCETDLPNSRLQTPLHIAVESGHLEVVQTLLAGGASLDAREKSGKSALQLAARGNYVSVVDMLIKAERYYAIARAYHDNDVGYVDPDTYLRNAPHPNAAHMKEVLWKLATKQLKPTDWKKLAHYWHFTPEHIKAIEQEYTGTMSYKDHGYRLLLIWLHGVRKDENVLKLLFEALIGIDKRHLAESIRRKANMAAEKEKPCSPSVCSVS